MTHRIEHLFSRIWRTELNISFLEYDAQNWTFFSIWLFLFNVTQRIGLVLKMTQRIAPFLKITQRIEPFSQCDSKIWTFFQSDSKNCFFFSIWLEELNPLFRICLNELNLFCRSTQRIEPCFFQYDSKTWHLLKIWFSRIEPFENLTQRIELLKVWLKALNPFFQYESTNRTHFSNMTQRIDFFFEYWIWLKELIFFFIWLNEYWLKEFKFLNSFTNMAYSKSSTHLNLFIWLNELDLFYMTQRIEPYWIITQRIEPFIFFHDSKNWTFFITWIFFFMTQRIEPFFLKRLNELNIFCDPKNCTQRILFWMWSKELNLFCWMWPKELNHCWITWRIDLFYKYDWELNPFWTFSYDRRNEHFLKWLKELNLFECDSKNWNFSIWHAQNWTSLFSNMTHRIEHLFSRIWRTELNNVTQRIEIFRIWHAQNWTSLFSNMTHRIFFSRIWLIELNIFFSKWLIELNIFFSKWLKELNFSKVTQRIELIFWKNNPQDWTFSLIWSKERIEILWYDTKDWIFLIWLTEPNTFFNITQRTELFLQVTQRSELFLFDKRWPKGLIFSDMTQRTEHFFEYDSKNWTLF